MHPTVQRLNFERLKKVAEHQRAVRRCEVEGMVENTEGDILAVWAYGLINGEQFCELEEILAA